MPQPTAGPHPQVCLAAERCGHLDFDTRLDTWYSSEGFHCGEAQAGDVGFWDIYRKVRPGVAGGQRALRGLFGTNLMPSRPSGQGLFSTG